MTSDTPLDGYDEFHRAVDEAVFNGIDHVLVTDRLFKRLCADPKTESFTYGRPGIEVFRAGTRDKIIEERDMNYEQYHELKNRKHRV